MGPARRVDMINSSASRIVLRIFPVDWRNDGRALEAVSIAADAAEGVGRTRLQLRQVLDLIGYATSVRVADSLLALSRPARAMTAALALISGLTVSVALFVAAELVPGQRLDAAAQLVQVSGRVAPFATLGFAIYALWMLAAIAVLLGCERIVLGCVWTLLLATAALPVVASLSGLARPSGYDIAALWCCAALVVVGHRTLLRTRLIARVAVVAAGFVLGAILAVVVMPPDGVDGQGWVYWGDPDVLEAAAWTAIVALALLTVGSELVPSYRGRWSVPGSLAALPWTILGVHERLDDHRPFTVISALSAWVILVALSILRSSSSRSRQRQAGRLPHNPALQSKNVQ